MLLVCMIFFTVGSLEIFALEVNVVNHSCLVVNASDKQFDNPGSITGSQIGQPSRYPSGVDQLVDSG